MSERARAWLLHGSLATLALALVVRFALGNAYNLYDDSYIYFTYAENFARGCGLDFRCDRAAPVEGFSSPLYMVCLLLLRGLTTDLETGATCFGALALSAALWLAADVTRVALPRVGWLAALAVLLALGCDEHVLLNGTSGMETALFMVVSTGAFRAAVRDDARSLSAWLALAVWTRPEGLLLWALAFAVGGWREVRLWRAPLAALSLLLAVRFTYYRDLLPNTYYAKSGGTEQHVRLGLQYIGDTLWEFLPAACAPLALLSGVLAVRSLLVAALVLLLFFLRSGGDVFGYGRLWMPFVPALYACAAIGLGHVLGRTRLPQLALAPLALWAAFVFKAHALMPTHGFANVLRWRTLGLYLGHAHVGARIATVPIGAISYFSRLNVVDLVGLTEREVAKSGNTVPADRLKRNWLGHERHNTAWVLAQHPDLIVFGTKFGTQPISDVQVLRAGFYAEWLLLRLAKQQLVPYTAYTPEIAPGVYWHMLISDHWRARLAGGLSPATPTE